MIKTPGAGGPAAAPLIPSLMLRNIFALLLLASFGSSLVGCKKEKTQAEQQAEKVKVFRDRQKKAAARAYQDIVEKYPDSPYAEQAKQKVEALGGVGAPTPKK